MRSYWVVSPNVNNDNKTVSDWRQASVLSRAALMGWDPEHTNIGHRFAHKIMPGDVILIARRYHSEAEIVGLGVVRGKSERAIKGVRVPGKLGSLRRLSPFIPVSKAPANIELIDALAHTAALAKLHPERRAAHQKVRSWMERKLLSHKRRKSETQISKKSGPQKTVSPTKLRLAALRGNRKPNYIFRLKAQEIIAKKEENRLLQAYRQWLQRQGRKLAMTKYGHLQCDGFEKERRNLIEAKSTVKREHIRMAVGQLLDYGFQIEKEFGKPNMAILLPKRPNPNSVSWLRASKISLIWREKRAFLDNANGQFT